MGKYQHTGSIKSKNEHTYDDSESEADKLDLKVELLLQHLKQDLKLLKRKHQSLDSKEFQAQLLVLIGANTREISKLVIKAYLPKRMLALNRLLNSSCRIGPKMDHSKSGQSRSRQDESLEEAKQITKGSSGRHLKQNQVFATESSWIEARLAYRRLIYKMLRDIETHCEDVICLSQNYL